MCTCYTVWLRVLCALFFKIVVYIKYKVIIFLVLKFLIGRWSVVGWSVVAVTGQWSVGRWSVVGWSVGRWSVEGGRLVGGFKKTQNFLQAKDWTIWVSFVLVATTWSSSSPQKQHFSAFDVQAKCVLNLPFCLSPLLDFVYLFPSKFSWITISCCCTFRVFLKKYINCDYNSWWSNDSSQMVERHLVTQLSLSSSGKWSDPGHFFKVSR